jgi:predicted metal-dependent enzyme (double-stranded beta helix superfamily)
MNLSGTQPAISDARLRRLVLDLAASSQGWLHLVRYDPGQRWYQRVLREEDREVWLLSWLPGQRTGFHDHGSSGGAFTVVQGCLRERAAHGGRPDPVGAALVPGPVRSFGPRYVHDVRNESARTALSVHAYSPPLTTMRRFDVSAGRLVPAAVETAARW